MRRPIGVTASAIVAILGSAVLLLLAALGTAGVFVGSARPHSTPNPASALAGAALFAVCGGIGIWTAVELLKLRPRGRTSILVFASFLAAGSILTLLFAVAAPLPPEVTASSSQSFRGTMAVVFGIPLAIAIWWLIQFNRPSTKAAFASSITELANPRPLSITIIAWISITGAMFSVPALLGGVPAFVLGAVFTGWAAGLVYALFAAVTLYIGKGLLDLREEARVVAIGWFGFSFLHFCLVTLVPAMRQRMLESRQGFTPDIQNAALDQGMLMTVMFAVGAIVSAEAIWFLIRNQAAFNRATGR